MFQYKHVNREFYPLVTQYLLYYDSGGHLNFLVICCSLLVGRGTCEVLACFLWTQIKPLDCTTLGCRVVLESKSLFPPALLTHSLTHTHPLVTHSSGDAGCDWLTSKVTGPALPDSFDRLLTVCSLHASWLDFTSTCPSFRTVCLRFEFSVFYFSVCLSVCFWPGSVQQRYELTL